MVGWSLFLLILTLVLFFAGVFTSLPHPPEGLHLFRQTDSAAFASHYYHYGNGLFEPANYNLSSIDGKGAAEFPLTYYIAGLLYHFFGEKDWILKGIHFFIFLCGVIFFWHSLKRYLESYWWSLVVTFSFLSGGVMLHYCNMTLPESPAIGFSLSGWALLLHGFKSSKASHLTWAAIFFTMSALLKVVYGIHLLTLVVYLLWRLKNDNYSFHELLKTYKWTILILLVGIVANSCWNGYAISYNQRYAQANFLTSSTPIWGMPQEHISGVVDIISNYWRPYLIYPTLLHTFGILSLFLLFLFKKTPYPDNLIIVVNVLALLSYVVLFFHQFLDHDYYFLMFYLPLSLWLMLGYSTVAKVAIGKSDRLYNVIGLSALLITALAVNYGIEKSNQRKEKTDILEEACVPIKENAKELQELIPKSSHIIVFGDYTRQASLYFLKRKGWTILDEEQLNRSLIDSLTSCGAQFLLLLKPVQHTILEDYEEINAPLPLYKLVITEL